MLIGGGPTVRDVDLSKIEGRARVITLNNSWELAPFNDIHFFADTRWWRWHGQKFPADYPARIVTVSKGDLGPGGERVFRMRKEHAGGLCTDPQGVYGRDSGMMAMNLAFNLGVSRIVLIGYDMRFTAGEGHWHEDHPIEAKESYYTDEFAPEYPPVVAQIEAAGVEVLRITPSALDFIPQVTLEDALSRPPRHRNDIYV
ncbi:alpha-2;3-sialyltransferase [Caulobacter phage CcrBL9]|uniref:Uncharacterized protein n=1 Tax=Caulobacter phage CcrBL9 TaxID=2283270 RepID=A0A385EEL1_9CAUD|nr:alpha-2;3-sialyltransferase [Caulobacter phage CcrBL9]AXQ69198.1 hypothetical protein CcrBL9_gp174 [Caulobacter phage CcrBL9]